MIAAHRKKENAHPSLKLAGEFWNSRRLTAGHMTGVDSSETVSVFLIMLLFVFFLASF